MGILSALLRKHGGLRPLDPGSPAAAGIAACRAQLEPFVKKVHVPLELVPAAAAVYVYLGKPPVDFGMAWFESGREVSLASLKEDQGLSQGRIQVLSTKLGEAYRKSVGVERFAATIAGKQVTVTPSDALAAEIRQAIEEASS